MTNETIRRQISRGGGAAMDEEDGGLPWLEPAPDPDRGTLSFKSLAIIGTVFLLVFIALLAVFYNRIAGTGGATGGPGGTPTLIAAPAGPYKVPPEVADRSNTVSGESDYAGEPRFADRSEEPVVGAERLSDAVREEGGVSVSLGGGDEPVVGFARPVETTPPPKADVSEPLVTPAPSKPQPKKPADAAPTTPTVAEASPSKPTQVAAAGNFLLQLGAFSTRESALNGWSQYSKQYPGSLAGLGPDVESVTNAAGKTLFRLRAAALPSRAAADQRCTALKSAGKGCFVVER